MITPNQAATALFHLLNVPELTTAITGKVQKGKRKTVAAGQEKQDVVVLELSNIPDGLQEGYLTVNIHVQDFKAEIDGISNLLPDSNTIDRIAAIVIPLIDDVFTEGVLFWITKLVTFEEPELNEHYLNIMVRYGHPNY